MIYFKTDRDIEKMKASALLLGKAHGEVAKHIKPGVNTSFLDKIATEYIKDHGAHPSFLNYNGFPAALCISLNEVVVHGIPGNYELRDGDLLSIDCGVYLDSFHADSAYSYPIGEVSEEVKKLLTVTKKSLELGIKQYAIGKRIGDVSYAIQKEAERNNFSIVRELVGHGVGKKLHESPEVPNFGKRGKGVKIQNGMVVAIEPMVNAGKRGVVQEADGWTIRTADRKPSAHFEHTVAIVNKKTEVLTTFQYIEEAFKYEYA
eukprot:TRINITY_DN64592_c0_g1_i1.p4 TRINITY_DN64592_c0_g1~~TRINITY_DN64592_c0_g1_i1.p4  ORF type:complete len:261 (+),score=-26.70 TRINITY_DN64592_c0_g1_i1:930-1712(+)